MGVPALFRWLSQKYPKIIQPVVEEAPREIDGDFIPVDTTKQNPNGEEFDNLYLDFNGIVHNCSHPEDRPAPETEGEMMVQIFKETERIMNVVRPRKLIMLAVDGVAPRAKMNQQRGRRFRAIQEAKEKEKDREDFIKMLKSQNGGVLDDAINATLIKKTWDSNSITPGTPFMDILAVSLRYWSAYKLSSDPAWAKLKIIVSDATVPGEGEHKIMEFIRSQRSSPEHDPNTRHVICGLDADLIMLGLATHEPHFRVLREDVFYNDSKPKTCRICRQTGHIAENCKGEVKRKQGEFDEKASTPVQKPFIWLNVSILREYLAVEMELPYQPFKFDLERALDDWVFMCFFVGNDFLPHLPSLDIREQGIDTLIAIWRDNLAIMGGYVTKDGHVDLKRAQHILAGLAKQEDAIFRRRRQQDQRREAGQKRRKLEDSRRNGQQNNRLSGNDNSPVSRWNISQPAVPISQLGRGSQAKHGITHDTVVNGGEVQTANIANKSAAAVLKERLLGRPAPAPQDKHTNPENVKSSSTTETPSDESPTSALGKRKADTIEQDENDATGVVTPSSAVMPQKDDDEDANPDTVKLWEEGYADRYYDQKFHVAPSDHEFRHKVARDYVEGLAWVLLYYFQGCPSWTWYYPHHYAPFAADFVDIENAKIAFTKGTPFKPFEQLMSVLPAASNHAIPDVFHSLMTDEDSPIIDFYPEDFPVDLNGKKFAWQGVVLLPFIDENRLLKAMEERYPLLSAEQHKRNDRGSDLLIFSDKHPLYESVVTNFYGKRQGAPKFTLNPKNSEGLAGKAEKHTEYLPGSSIALPFEAENMPDIEEDHSMIVNYEIPKSGNIHKSMILRGAVFPRPTLDNADIEATRARARNSGRSFGGVPLRAGNEGGRNGGRGRGRDQFNYGDSRPNLSNPFAAHLDPQFFANGAPIPPPMQSRSAWGPQNPPSQAYPLPGSRYGNQPQSFPSFPQDYGRGESNSNHQSRQQQGSGGGGSGGGRGYGYDRGRSGQSGQYRRF